MTEEWEYEEIAVRDIQSLLATHQIEVDSPDGWVRVEDYVEKGMHEEYILTSKRGETVRVSNGHRFESKSGWICADEMLHKSYNILHDDGRYYECEVHKTGEWIPIVDIVIDHPNHRYYTAGVSSHNTGAGKSLVKCHMAANSLLIGKNVLYITMELAEEEVARRIDANIMDITLDQLLELPRPIYEKKIGRFKNKTPGKLIIKEYPTGSANAAHFRHLLNELRLKKNFKPDVIFIDYLNICASSRIRGAAAANSYTLVKSIAEEVRGLAMEFDVPIVSSSQLNRDGYCLALDTKVNTKNGVKSISELVVGDEVESNDNKWNRVQTIFPQKKKKAYRITTKSGDQITCSAEHLFPTENGEKSIKDGLIVGEKIFIK